MPASLDPFLKLELELKLRAQTKQLSDIVYTHKVVVIVVGAAAAAATIVVAASIVAAAAA